MEPEDGPASPSQSPCSKRFWLGTLQDTAKENMLYKNKSLKKSQMHKISLMFAAHTVYLYDVALYDHSTMLQ